MGVVGADFRDVMEMLSEKCSSEEMGLIATIARSLWRRRNTVLHRGLFTNPNCLVHEAKEALLLFLEANEKQGQVYEFQSAAGGDMEAWRRPPPPGVYKINWDVGLDEKTPRLGVGVISRDSEGMVIAARSLTIQTKQDPVISHWGSYERELWS